tara:strand:- start:898 stop:1575 length:678 start_codon:yes stop_codon:yes gene_type:complete
MSPIKTLALASVAAMAFSYSANALTITDSDSLGPNTTELNSAVNTLTVDLFDDMGGTRVLNKVILTIDARLDSSGTVTNNAAQMQNFSVQVNSMFSSAGGPAPIGSLNASVQIGPQAFNLASGASAPFGPSSATDQMMVMFTNPGDLAAFLGAGTFSIGIDTLSGQQILGGGGNITAAISTQASATLTVDYDYQNVTTTDEPATLAMAGLALAGMVAIRRRARAR